MKSTKTKYYRIEQITQILLDSPLGVSQSELAQRLGVSRSTICRDISDMSSTHAIYNGDGGRILIDKSQYQFDLKMTALEMEALHLFSRLFVRVIKFPFPSAGCALRKMAETQLKSSPVLAQRILETAHEIDQFAVETGSTYDRYRKVVEVIGEALTEQKALKIRHFSASKQLEREYKVFPYTLEPHPEGRSVHLLGWNLETNTPITLKIERIQGVELLVEDWKLSPLMEETLKSRHMSAWSIWTTDAAPAQVHLRFSKDVSSRVKETQWHKSQTTQELSDGKLLLIVAVAAPQEMYPWIRGWGPDVEVLLPLDLREKHRQDFEVGRKLYE